jgi:hypothetical protein
VTLFESIVGAKFAELPAEVRRVHDARLSKILRGRCDIVRGDHWLAAPVAWSASLPKTSSNVVVTVNIRRDGNAEHWCRDFGGHKMESTLWPENGVLVERLGLLEFHFALQAMAGAIEWRVLQVRLFGVSLPLSWFSATRAVETCIDGRYTFDVTAALPFLGPLIRYHGWLIEDGPSTDHRF